MSGFDIKNDPSAAFGAATYPAQAQPDEQDILIMSCAHQGTGLLAFNSIGLPQCLGSTTITNSSNGINTSSFSGSGTLNVTSTTNFSSSGTIYVATAGTTATITYTSKTSTTFTGCNTTAGGGVMSTGGAVTGLMTSISGFWYQILGKRYVSSIGLATVYNHAAADTTYDRWDMLYADTSGVVGIAQGTPAANPCLPTLSTDGVGRLNVLPLTAVYIPANAKALTNNNLVTKYMEILSYSSRTPVADAAYSMSSGASTASGSGALDTYIAYTSITANRIVTLSAASSVPPGFTVTVADESGDAFGNSNGTGSSKAIQVKPAGSDTVHGVAAATNFEVIKEPFGSITLRSDGVSNWEIVSVTPSVRQEVFTTTVASGWRKSLISRRVHVLAIGGGGAGGSGEKRATSVPAGGGGGGQGGGMTDVWLDPDDLNVNETPTVGTGGTGGGATSSTGNGASGNSGNDSKFTVGGTVNIFAQGGAGGGGGTNGAAGTAGSGNNNSFNPGASGGAGAKGSATAAAAVAGAAGSAGGPGGGGGGGGFTTAPAVEAAAAGGTASPGIGTTTGAGVAGGTAGTSGASPTVGGGGNAGSPSSPIIGSSQFYGGSGGGGGGTTASTNVAGKDGGAGGLYGGGGGGGGAGNGTGNGGNGGAGGAGVVVVTTYR